jgi:hypothetical protein
MRGRVDQPRTDRTRFGFLDRLKSTLENSTQIEYFSNSKWLNGKMVKMNEF